MKINKGMYCYDKSNRKAGIGKIIEFWKNNNVLIEYKNNINSVSKGNVVASFNIIDLIEVGDYVNGYKVDYTNLKCETPFLRSNQPYRVDNTLYSELIKKGKDYNQPLHFYNDDIKSILTKEQFNSMKYVVERDTNENL